MSGHESRLTRRKGLCAEILCSFPLQPVLGLIKVKHKICLYLPLPQVLKSFTKRRSISHGGEPDENQTTLLSRDYSSTRDVLTDTFISQEAVTMERDLMRRSIR